MEPNGIITSTEQTTNKVAIFLYEHSTVVVFCFVLLVALTIACAVFLIILWRLYKKDELILKKYKIDPSQEDINELKQLDKKI